MERLQSLFRISPQKDFGAKLGEMQGKKHRKADAFRAFLTRQIA